MEKPRHKEFSTSHEKEEKLRTSSLREAIFRKAVKQAAAAGSAVFAACALGCAPVGMAAEHTNLTQPEHPAPSSAAVPDATASQELGNALGDMMRNALFPEPAWTKISSEAKEQIQSSPLALAIKSMTDRFSPQQITAIIDELPEIYTPAIVDGKQVFVPRFDVSLVKALSEKNVLVHVSLPNQRDLSARGLTREELLSPISANAASEWQTRYQKNLSIADTAASASFTANYIPVDSIREFNAKNLDGKFSVPRMSPLIGQYEEVLGADVNLPALSHTAYFGNASESIPQNVLDAQDTIMRSKIFTAMVVSHITGDQQSSDPSDIGYNSIETIAQPFSQISPGTPDVTRVQGSDGNVWGIIPLNSQINLDKSNLLVRALIDVVSQKNFEEKQ